MPPVKIPTRVIGLCEAIRGPSRTRDGNLMIAIRIMTSMALVTMAISWGCDSDREAAAGSVLMQCGRLVRAAAEGERRFVASFLLDATDVGFRCASSR